MTRDDIIRMAREAGFEEYEESSLSGDSELDQTLQVGEYPVGEAVFKFAALIAAAEREACAELCEERGLGWLEVRSAKTIDEGCMHSAAKAEAIALATAIRARGKK